MENSNSASVMNKASSSSSSQNMGSFPSPGAPYYRNRTKSLENNKGWSSERVTKATSRSSSRRHTMTGLTFTPFSGGRTMPSKWDEAERWICSPISASSYADNSRSSLHAQHQRRPKSISGPIVPPPGVAFYSNYSPAAVPLRQGFVVRNLMVGSPFSTGVLAPVAVSVHHYDSHDAVFGYDIDNGIQYSSPVFNEHGVAVHSSMSTAPTCSEFPCDPSSPIFQGNNITLCLGLLVSLPKLNCIFFICNLCFWR